MQLKNSSKRTSWQAVRVGVVNTMWGSMTSLSARVLVIAVVCFVAAGSSPQVPYMQGTRLSYRVSDCVLWTSPHIRWSKSCWMRCAVAETEYVLSNEATVRSAVGGVHSHSLHVHELAQEFVVTWSELWRCCPCWHVDFVAADGRSTSEDGRSKLIIHYCVLLS